MADPTAFPPRLSPFSALFAVAESDPDPAVMLTARTLDQVQIDCDPKLAGTIALPLPPAGRAVSIDDMRLLSMAPGRWIAVSTDTPPLIDRLQATCGPNGAVLVEQGHGRAALRISGPRSRDLLAKGTGLDLHPRAFAENSVASTALFHVAVTIDRRRGSGTFDVHMPRGYAHSLAERLIAAGRQFGVGITA
ncbi:MAG: hypothetical protein NXI18_18435 [Alphaproteobacteria bacterium]|nr:hypothetical protein [Alphaproteobacteria bacterium]